MRTGAQALKQIRNAAVEYFNPLHNAPLNVIEEFEAWDKPSRMIQIRFITLLTGFLYVVCSLIEHTILSGEALAFATMLHLYFLPPLLFMISVMSMYRKLYKAMILVLAVSPVLADIGNLYLVESLRNSPIYLSEAYSSEVYLIIIWIFAISGLRIFYALISAFMCAVLTLGYQMYFFTPKEVFYLHQLWIGTAFSLGIVSAMILEKNNKRLFIDAQQLEQLASTDKLSGLYNRMKIESFCEIEIERSSLYNETFSVILIDVDYFKEINDTYGHNIGDSVIKNISKILQDSIRRIDYVGRWGGEEFVIILPKTTMKEAFDIAEEIRLRVMHNNFSPADHVTISAGIAQYRSGDTTEKIIQRSDEELYKAKEGGRNQIQMDDTPFFFEMYTH